MDIRARGRESWLENNNDDQTTGPRKCNIKGTATLSLGKISLDLEGVC